MRACGSVSEFYVLTGAGKVFPLKQKSTRCAQTGCGSYLWKDQGREEGHFHRHQRCNCSLHFLALSISRVRILTPSFELKENQPLRHHTLHLHMHMGHTLPRRFGCIQCAGGYQLRQRLHGGGRCDSLLFPRLRRNRIPSTQVHLDIFSSVFASYQG